MVHDAHLAIIASSNNTTSSNNSMRTKIMTRTQHLVKLNFIVDMLQFIQEELNQTCGNKSKSISHPCLALYVLRQATCLSPVRSSKVIMPTRMVVKLWATTQHVRVPLFTTSYRLPWTTYFLQQFFCPITYSFHDQPHPRLCAGFPSFASCDLHVFSEIFTFVSDTIKCDANRRVLDPTYKREASQMHTINWKNVYQLYIITITSSRKVCMVRLCFPQHAFHADSWLTRVKKWTSIWCDVEW